MLGDSLKDLTDDLNQTEKETRSFINGKSPVGNGTDITLNEYLPPEGKKASLKDSYIKSTNTVKTADGGYKLTIVLKSETSKFDGNKFSATPANASVSTAFSSFDFGDGSDSIPFDMSLQFSGTKLEATANAAGKLVGLKIYSPMKMVMPLDITMGGYSSQTYTVTYR